MFGGSSTLSENDCDLCLEILKSLYTLTMDWNDNSSFDDDPHVKEVFLKATPTIIGTSIGLFVGFLTRSSAIKMAEKTALMKTSFILPLASPDLLKSRCVMKDRSYEMKSQIVNLMTNYPVTLYGSLVPFKDSTASSEPEKMAAQPP